MIIFMFVLASMVAYAKLKIVFKRKTANYLELSH